MSRDRLAGMNSVRKTFPTSSSMKLTKIRAPAMAAEGTLLDPIALSLLPQLDPQWLSCGVVTKEEFILTFVFQ